MKHSYICYAAVSESDHFSNKEAGIFEFDWSVDEQNQPERYYKEWCFDPEIIVDCAHADKSVLAFDIEKTNCPAKIKKYKITVEELPEND